MPTWNNSYRGADDIEAGGEEATNDEVPASFLHRLRLSKKGLAPVVDKLTATKVEKGLAPVVDKLIATTVKQGLFWVSPLTGETHYKFVRGR